MRRTAFNVLDPNHTVNDVGLCAVKQKVRLKHATCASGSKSRASNEVPDAGPVADLLGMQFNSELLCCDS